MKAHNIYALVKGDKINHKHYGVCTVHEIVPNFGPAIIPDSDEMKDLMKAQMDTVQQFQGYPKGTPFLETSFRMITRKVIIKTFIITYENGFQVEHESETVEETIIQFKQDLKITWRIKPSKYSIVIGDSNMLTIEVDGSFTLAGLKHNPFKK